jgi:hypothetical protein
MNIQILQAEQEDGWEQHSNDGRTRWIKTLPAASNPSFQNALVQTSHTVSWKAFVYCMTY